MTGQLQPLDQKFAIVDQRGNPTEYFIRWAQQRQIDIGDSINLGDLQTYLTEHSLQEGAGIQITPSGDLNDSPTISADVQEILDQLSSSRGAVIYRGLLGWEVLLPGTNGFFLKTSGPGTDPAWASAGGGGSGKPWYWLPPLAADLPVLFNGIGGVPVITDDADLGFVLRANAVVAGFASNVRAKVVPAGDWTAEAHVIGDGTPSNSLGVGIAAVETGTNKIATMSLLYEGVYQIDPWSGTTTAFTSRGTRFLRHMDSLFVRIRYVLATNTYHFDYSLDGKTWFLARSVIATTLFTVKASHVGVVLSLSGAPVDGLNRAAICDRWITSF